MKDNLTPAPQAEVRKFIKKCLENAAFVNYDHVSQTIAGIRYKKVLPLYIILYIIYIIDVGQDPDMHPSLKMQKLINLAELCVNMVQENNNHYSEV